jgi:GxxExxY protein
VYENAVMIKLTQKGLTVVQQAPITVFFKNQLVGEYFAGILVNDVVIVELMVVSELARAHEAQILNYLKSTGKKVGLLINFGEKLKVARRAL